MRFRLAEAGDVEVIRQIYAPYVETTTYTFEYEVPSMAEFRKRFDHVTAYFPWLVLEDEGAVCGYAYAERIFQRAAYQWDVDSAIYLKQGMQGRGLAAQLYDCLETLLAMQGFQNIYALVTSSNTASMRFHEKMGYEREALFKKTGYKAGAWLDVTWYRKRLLPAEPCPQPTISFYDLPEADINDILHIFNVKLNDR